MNKRELVSALTRIKVVPVISHHDPDVAMQGALLLAEAGFFVLELTFTVADAACVIAELSRALPEAIIGAGTVLNDRQAHEAVKAGAKFVVSPCWIDDAAEACIMEGTPYIPGAATAGEIMHHWQNGASVVKIFPARDIGGPGFLKTMRAVFPDIPLMPMGGVKPETAGKYFAAGAICIAIGGELLPVDALSAGDHDTARANIAVARDAMKLVH